MIEEVLDRTIFGVHFQDVSELVLVMYVIEREERLKLVAGDTYENTFFELVEYVIEGVGYRA